MDKSKKLNIVKKKVSEFDKGMQVEQEHTTKFGKQYDIAHGDQGVIKKIVKVHLRELPDYYDRLEKMEDRAKKDKNGKEE